MPRICRYNFAMNPSIALIVLLSAGACFAQTAPRGYYTDQRLAHMRDNLEAHDWAQQTRDNIIAAADKWLQYDADRLRSLVVPPYVPRAVTAHTTFAPVDGDKLFAKGRYSWIIDFDNPWKVKHPTTGAVYPDNDFAPFLASDMTDRSLLGEGEYVDDGWGAPVDGFDKPFWFVGVYAHWSVVRLLLPAIENLSKAYLITGDERYAHACALLLWQLAEYYPDYNYESQSRYAKEVKPDYKGRLLYHTWESLWTCQTVPPAYDAIRPAIDSATQLQQISGQSAAEIRQHIEQRMLVTMAGDIMDGSGRIAGNFGMHQVSLLRIAAALHDRTETPTRQDMIDWVMQTNENAGNYTGLGLNDAINNLIKRDGYPYENPGYNTLWVESIAEIIGELGGDAAMLLDRPRVRQMFDWPLRMAVLDKFLHALGDGGNLHHGLTGWSTRVMEPGYRLTGDPRYAAAMARRNVKPTRDLFSRSIEADIAEAAATYDKPLASTSTVMPSLGYGTLQTGVPANRTALALLWGFYNGHAHFDQLDLELYINSDERGGYALIPDFGYPESADVYDPRRFGWLSHTATHNTVMIDATRSDFKPGRPHVWDPGDNVQLLEASAETAYPDVAKLYRRTVMLVDLAPDRAVVVDIFRVRGGKQHDWLVHGGAAEFSSELPLTEPRTKGTLAGEDVEYGEFYDDERYADDNKAHVAYYYYKGSAFQWLFNVQQTPLDGVGTASWTRGSTLRAHMLGDDETIFVADGEPQRYDHLPDTVKFLVRRRTLAEGDDGELSSTFVTVFEPYWDEPMIDRVEAIEVGEGDTMRVALRLHLGDRVVEVNNQLEGASPRALVREGDAVVYELNGREPLTATVNHVDYDTGVVMLSEPIDFAPAGGSAIVEHSDGSADIVGIAQSNGEMFTVADPDLSEATVHIESLDGRNATVLPKFLVYPRPDLTLINERGEIVGKVAAVDGYAGTLSFDRDVSMDDLPDVDGDGRRSVRMMVIGPGDRVTLHRSIRSE
jgi:hypothetical protein